MARGMDLSKYSNEELLEIAKGGMTSNNQSTSYEEPSYTKEFLKGLGSFGKGAIMGAGQASEDLVSSILNAPIEGLEYLTGREYRHVPHLHLANENPASLSEASGQALGSLGASIAAPLGGGIKAAKFANKLPALGKLIASSLGGAATGALTNDEDRTLGAIYGAGLGVSGHAVPAAFKYLQSTRPKNIANEIELAVGKHKATANQEFNTNLLAGEEAGANKFLTQQKGDIKLIKKAGSGDKNPVKKDLTFSLEEYNKNPTLTNAHYAQRDLNKLVAKYKGSTPGTIEAKAYKEALKLKNNLLLDMQKAFEKSGVKHHGQAYDLARQHYREDMGPYLSSPAIKKFLSGDIRRESLADTILGRHGSRDIEEKFLKEKGHEIPGLERREKLKKFGESKIVNTAVPVAGGAALGALGVPYMIRKLLGAE